MGKMKYTIEMIQSEIKFIHDNEGQICVLNELRHMLLNKEFLYCDSGGYLRTTSAGKEKIKISPHELTTNAPSEACTNTDVSGSLRVGKK
jgi:hypothetical protein